MKKTKKPKAPRIDDKVRVALLYEGGRIKEAEALIRQMLVKNGNDVYAIFHVSLSLYNNRQYAEGLRQIERGISLAPAFAPNRYAHAMMLQALGRNEDALQSYDKAIELQPDYDSALLNSGVLLRSMFRYHQALERFEQLLASAPDHQAALGNCATLLAQLSQPERAIPMFERLVQLNPGYPFGQGMLCYERLRSCDWTDLGPLSQAIVEGVRAGREVCRSFALMAIPSSASDQYLCARTFAARRFPKAAQSLWNGERYCHPRIRIGYVSPDFREHPVSHLMSGIFERHDRSRFETIAISIGLDDKSRFRRRLEKSFDQFIDMAGQGGLQIAQRIRALEVDILVDLAGYTSDGRPEIFTHRPAPIQATFLGFPGTLGTDYFDYIVADRHVIPPEHQAFYAEQVAYLPDTYLPTDSSVQVAMRTPSRAECGLPETGAVLCAFSHNFKVHPALFDVWMRLLAQIPESVLWLASRDGPMQAHLKREAQARGVDPVRLVFAGRVPLVEDHLARYRLADLFLDTSPYNAHTTAADALLVGLPVVTCQGAAFPARVAASLLHAIGLPELITHSLAEYEALVLQLITDKPRLQEIKARLQANRQTHPLFDSDRFCRNLETVFLAMQPARVAEPLMAAVSH